MIRKINKVWLFHPSRKIGSAFAPWWSIDKKMVMVVGTGKYKIGRYTLPLVETVQPIVTRVPLSVEASNPVFLKPHLTTTLFCLWTTVTQFLLCSKYLLVPLKLFALTRLLNSGFLLARIAYLFKKTVNHSEVTCFFFCPGWWSFYLAYHSKLISQFSDLSGRQTKVDICRHGCTESIESPSQPGKSDR